MEALVEERERGRAIRQPRGFRRADRPAPAQSPPARKPRRRGRVRRDQSRARGRICRRRDDPRPCRQRARSAHQRPGRAVRRQSRPRPRRSGCRAMLHGRSPSAWRPSARHSASISRRTRSMPRGTCSPRTRCGPSPRSPNADRRGRAASGRRWPALIEDVRWRTSAKGRRYMMATISDSRGQFVATAFDDDATAALEAAAKAGSAACCPSSSTAAPETRRPGSRSSAFQPLTDLAKRTRLQMTVRIADAAMVAAHSASSRMPAGRTASCASSSRLLAGGEATLVAGRDFLLDAELAARIERISGEGSVDLSIQEPPKLALVG